MFLVEVEAIRRSVECLNKESEESQTLHWLIQLSRSYQGMRRQLTQCHLDKDPQGGDVLEYHPNEIIHLLNIYIRKHCEVQQIRKPQSRKMIVQRNKSIHTLYAMNFKILSYVHNPRPQLLGPSTQALEPHLWQGSQMPSSAQYYFFFTFWALPTPFHTLSWSYTSCIHILVTGFAHLLTHMLNLRP